jgi:hypothetical protein
MDAISKKWATTLNQSARAMGVAGIALTLWSCAPTVSVDDAGVTAVGIDGVPGLAVVMVGETVLVSASPYQHDGQHIDGATIRWSSEDPRIATLTGPEVTLSNYEGVFDDRKRTSFKGVGAGTTYLVGTLEGLKVQNDISSNTPGVLRVRIPITVVSPPSRIDLVPQATVWRVGHSLLLDARVYSADGTQITDLSHTPYKIVFRCLDAPIGVFGFLGIPETGASACQQTASIKGALNDGFPHFAVTNTGAEVVGVVPGIARFEAVLERADAASQIALPNARAQVAITFTRAAQKTTFDAASVTVRLGSAVDVAFHMRDENGAELPTGDVEGTIADRTIATETRIATGWRVVGETILGIGQSTTTLEAQFREGVYLNPLLGPPPTRLSIPIIVLPRILDLEIQTEMTVFEGERKEFAIRLILEPGTSIDPPYRGLTRSISSDDNALATAGFSAAQTLSIKGVSAGPTGVVRVPMRFVTVDEGGFSKPFFVTVRRLRLAVSPPQAKANLGATQLFVLNQVDETDHVVSEVPNEQIAWTSADVAIATVDAAGLARCTQRGGTVAVRGTHTATNVFASASLTCGTGPTISVTPPTVTVEVGKTSPTITATVLNAAGTVDVTWSAPTNSNFTIAKTGATTATVSGLSVTTADLPLTATYTQGGTSYTATSSIKVTPAVVNGYTVAATTVTFTPGSTTPTLATLPITRTGTFTAALGFVSATGAPSGLSVVPSATSFSTAVTLNISGTAAAGAYPLAVTTNAIGSTLQPQTTTLTVVIGGSTTPTVAAVYLDPRDAEMTASAAQNGAGGLTYRARLVDSQGNEVLYTSSGGTLAYTSSTLGAVKIGPVSTGPVIVTGLSGEATVVTNIRATFTKGNQILTDETPLTIYPASSPAEHYGTVEVSMPRDARVLKVGDKIQVPVIVRDRNGIQQLTGVTGLTLTSSNPAAIGIGAVIPAPGAVSNGYFFELTVKAATPIPGVRITADVAGAASSIYIVVTP